MSASRGTTSITIPASIRAAVVHALQEQGDTTPIQRIQRVSGGFESTAVRLSTRRRDYFLKWSATGTHGSFQAEARHLALLASTGALAVPTVLRAVDPPPPARGEAPTPADDALGFLLMEWLTPPSREVFQRRVGRKLGVAVARLHGAQAIGEVPIAGYGPAAAIDDGAAWRADWINYYREHTRS